MANYKSYADERRQMEVYGGRGMPPPSGADGRWQMEVYGGRGMPPPSGADGRWQMEVYGGRGMPPPSGMHDMRSYSTSYVPSQHSYEQPSGKGIKLKKGKSLSGTSSSKGGFLGMNDPEFQRKKRVAGYKVYTVEGRMKGSFRKSFRWLKDRYTQVVHGWW